MGRSMRPLLLGAGQMTALTALVHSVVGERLIFRQLRSSGIVPAEESPLLREGHPGWFSLLIAAPLAWLGGGL